MKLLTFAIPCYNSQDYMEHCIDSILPGGDDVEILIIDDGSKDRTAEIADAYEAKYPGIVRAIHQENGGHGEAVNAGIRNATGLFFKVVDSDDWVDEEAYKQILKKLKEFAGGPTTLDMMLQVRKNEIGLTLAIILIRPEATGFGAAYFAQHLLNHEGTSFEGKKVAITGFGNVAWGVATKVTEMGGTIVTVSGPDGYIYDPEGVKGEKIDYLLDMRASGANKVSVYADKFPSATFYPGEKPWGKIEGVDVYMPCATQNEIKIEDAEAIVKQGVKYVVEVSNMPCTNDAIACMQKAGIVMAPSKAVNAGGVAVSALEMSQNSQRLSWTAEEVDKRLFDIMKDIHDNAASAAEEYGLGYNLMAGANLAGFRKVARAMYLEGVL